MAKICQNELNPNLAWIYLGMAVRTSLSAGINRNTSIRHGVQAQDMDALQESKTWWGLYSLEIELSFALGRPDTLGIDDFHNRPMPAIDDSEVAIITSMIELARIMRTISVSIYLPRLSLAEKLTRASGIEASMDAWVVRLPKIIRPTLTPDVHNAGGSLRDPAWAPKLLPSRALSIPLKEAVTKCVSAAVNTIETIHETCRVHMFFRTWFYNATYLTFAGSILLFRAAQPAHLTDEHTDYLPVIEKSLDLLDAMDESVVASKTADVLRHMITQLRGRRHCDDRGNDDPASFATQAQNNSAGVAASQAVDSAVVPEGVDVFSLGSDFWDGGMWNWGGYDLDLGWEFESEFTMI
ncbi:hypothetical protein H2199_008538 [Coniosporium tulheliwenetii]|uniref:Uncharacterized protein n=1 Tax=Coniosporium tulheliwenetii TaxID=3383036 RepID=A0ACC2YJX4_9PEZI|nr:hypothetical protein H2199_008538 [Cladosporium sp. JES 115]